MTPLFTAIAFAPDQKSGDRNAFPSSIDGDGKSASLLPSSVCANASKGVGCSIDPKPRIGSYASFERKPSPCAISWRKTDRRSYSRVVGAPSPRRFHAARALTLICISEFRISRSLPASAFANAEGYQRLGSGAPENPAK